MFLDSKRLSSETAITPLSNWAFKIFCASTLFIVIFSVEAIYIWPPFIEKFSILLACILPTSMAIWSRTRLWIKEKSIPPELTWVILVFLVGLLSSLFSESPWISLKSLVLFIVSGPFIFFTTKTLFESIKNQEVFIWLITLAMFILSLMGFYELSGTGLYLFSRNPLPAGALLILFSAGTMILLNRKISPALNIVLILGLVSSIVLIILTAKKSHYLSTIVILIMVVVFINERFLKYLLGFIIVASCFLYISVFIVSTNKGFINFNSSVTLRAENYFFGYHLFKKNPIWGFGFKPDFAPYFDDYNVRLAKYLQKKDYQKYIKTHNTFENIIITYFIERGSLFSLTYFGGLVYIVTISFKRLRSPPNKDMGGIFLASVITGFAVLSLTFDTLRFPNLNWIFHSLLGLLANLPNKSFSRVY